MSARWAWVWLWKASRCAFRNEVVRMTFTGQAFMAVVFMALEAIAGEWFAVAHIVCLFIVSAICVTLAFRAGYSTFLLDMAKKIEGGRND